MNYNHNSMGTTKKTGKLQFCHLLSSSSNSISVMFDRFYPPSPPEDTQSLHQARIPRPSGHFQRWEEKTPESADSRDPGFSW